MDSTGDSRGPWPTERDHVGIHKIPDSQPESEKSAADNVHCLLTQRLEETAFEYHWAKITPSENGKLARVSLSFTPYGSFAPYLMHMVTGILIDGTCYMRVRSADNSLRRGENNQYLLEMSVVNDTAIATERVTKSFALILDPHDLTDHDVLTIWLSSPTLSSNTEIRRAVVEAGVLTVYGRSPESITNLELERYLECTIDGKRKGLTFEYHQDCVTEDGLTFYAIFRINYPQPRAREFSIVRILPSKKWRY